MKEKRQKQKEKSKIVFEKLMQKEERLQNIRKAKEKERKKLENKIDKMIQKKQLFDKKKELVFYRIRRARDELFKKIKNNKKQLEKEEALRREDILDEENNKFGKIYH